MAMNVRMYLLTFAKEMLRRLVDANEGAEGPLEGRGSGRQDQPAGRRLPDSVPTPATELQSAAPLKRRKVLALT